MAEDKRVQSRQDLRDGSPSRVLGWSRFSFNVGVETGQTLVIVTVASALFAVRSHNESAGRERGFAGSLVSIAVGTFWFVQRVFFGTVA